MRHGNLFPAALVSASLFLPTLGGCRYDPVIQEKIEQNPPEDPEGPSELHRRGQPCVDCHSSYEGAEPALAVGGTVFHQDPFSLALSPVEGVFVTIFDSAGATHKACTNKAGNFFITRDDLAGIDDFAFPLTVQVGHRYMRSLVGRERSCAGCHELATIPKVNQDPSTDPSTGKARDSAGAILVDPSQVPVTEYCGPGVGGPVAGGTGGAVGTGGAAGGSGGAGGGGGQ